MFDSCNEIEKYIVDHQVKFINLYSVDADGSMKCETFLANILTHHDFENGVKFFTNSDCDLLLKPDLQTYFLNPFSSQITLSFLCNVIDCNTKEISKYCARSYLKNTSQFLLEKFDNFHVYIEFEFDIFDDHEMKNADFFHDILSETLETGKSVGIKMYSHFSKSTSSNTVIFSSNDLLKLADDIYKLKFVILNVVHSYGKKTDLDINKWQKCLKMKFTLQKNGKNFFEDPTECGDFLRKINQNAELINIFVLGDKQVANQNDFLQKVFDKIYLNFNYINIQANIYLALHILFSCAIDKNHDSSEKEITDFSCFTKMDLYEQINSKKITTQYINENLLEKYISSIVKIIKNIN